jgi:hypothetical protein
VPFLLPAFATDGDEIAARAVLDYAREGEYDFYTAPQILTPGANSGTSRQLAINHENGARSFPSPEPLQRVHDALERGDVGDDTG